MAAKRPLTLTPTKSPNSWVRLKNGPWLGQGGQGSHVQRVGLGQGLDREARGRGISQVVGHHLPEDRAVDDLSSRDGRQVKPFDHSHLSGMGADQPAQGRQALGRVVGACREQAEIWVNAKGGAIDKGHIRLPPRERRPDHAVERMRAHGSSFGQ
jgi:hypothetical protein